MQLLVFSILAASVEASLDLNDFLWPPVYSVKSTEFHSFCSVTPSVLTSLLSQHFGDPSVVLSSLGFQNAVEASSLPRCAFQRCRSVRKPSDGLIESYTIKVEDSSCTFSCGDRAACRRAMFTLLGLFHVTEDKSIVFPKTSFEISDHSSVAHRGLMLDTGRRFLPVEIFVQHLALMAVSGMNVLHWHISDDQSFPVSIESTEKAFRYSNRSKYTISDLQTIAKVAEALGIELVLEMDVPTHSQSLVWGYPEISSNKVNFGLDITKDEAYAKIRAILEELHENLGVRKFHLGGDETWSAWNTPAMEAWARSQGMEPGNKKQLILYYLRRLQTAIGNFEVTLWEDFLDELGVYGEDAVDPEIAAIVKRFTWQFWRTDKGNFEKLDRLGVSYTYSEPFYLDHLNKNWADYYSTSFRVGKYMRGGEACMWGEFSDHVNSVARVWPRAAAVAARLIEGERNVDPLVRVRPLSLWVCRMRQMKLNVDPVGNFAGNGGDLIDPAWPLQWSCDSYEDGSFFGPKPEEYRPQMISTFEA